MWSDFYFKSSLWNLRLTRGPVCLQTVSPGMGFSSFLSAALICISLVVCFYIKDFIIAFLTLPQYTPLCTCSKKQECIGKDCEVKNGQFLCRGLEDSKYKNCRGVPHPSPMSITEGTIPMKVRCREPLVQSSLPSCHLKSLHCLQSLGRGRGGGGREELFCIRWSPESDIKWRFKSHEWVGKGGVV